MKHIPALEFSIQASSGGVFTIRGLFYSSEQASDLRIGEKAPIVIDLDLLVLKDSLPDMKEYGRILSEALFVPEAKKLFLYAITTVAGGPLRLQLSFGSMAAELHNLHWETLINPIDKTLLAANQNILFSRYLASESWIPVRLREKKQLRALVAVAGPSDLANHKLALVDVKRETERAVASLGEIEVTILPAGNVHCTLPAIMDELRKGYDILYLVAHGTRVQGMPYLWLENDEGKVKRISGEEFAAQVKMLSALPCLVILASCESAGNAGDPLNAFGPLLAETGVPAVVAMQGKISMFSVERMMPVFFRELLKDGLADRALAAARGALLAENVADAWAPVLFSRLKTGQVWMDKPEKDQIIQESFRLQRVWFPLIFLTVIGVGVGLYFGLHPQEKPVMTGEFRIAVASFAEVGQGLPDKVGYTIGDGIQIRLSEDLKEISVGPKVEIWGPDRIATITGGTPEDRANNAAHLAREIQAFMIIYGVVESNGNEMRVVPEFYLDTQGFSEGNEIIGQYELGAPFSVPGINNPAWTYEFNKKMYSRSDVISSLATGLSYFAVHDYEASLEIFQGLEKMDVWDDNSGKKVIYALTGFAAGKVGDKKLDQDLYDEADAMFSLAQDLLEKSLEIDPEYARPYIGIANLHYMRALLPVQLTNDWNKTDISKLEICLEYLERAEQAQNKPPLAEVETKIHFARGQCLMQQTLAGVNTNLEPAFNEFRWVTQKYAQEKNERIKELAGESHARIGLIYRLLGKNELAIPEYKAAIDLLRVYPERKTTYENALLTLSAPTPVP